MARAKTLAVAQLNISLDAHQDPGRYLELFTAAKRKRRRAQYRANNVAMIGWSHKYGDGIIGGELYRFVDFDPEASWINLDKEEEADKDLIDQIPKNVRPGMKRVPFAFFATSQRGLHHRLFVDTSSTSVYLLRSIWDKLVNGQSDLVSVSIIQKPEAIEEVLSMPGLRTLELVIRPPNPDDLEGLEEKMRKRLRKQRAASLTQILKADRTGGHLEPDEETRALAEVARTNGSVRAVGEDEDGHRAEKNTLEHPQILSVTVPQQGDAVDAIVKQAPQLLRKF